MSRKYMNERWCVRCGRTTPNPFVVQNLKYLFGDRSLLADVHEDWRDYAVLDIGCGNGRNINAFKKLGCKNVVGFDMAGDGGHPFTLGKRPMPIFNGSTDIILANYVFMFLNKEERAQVIRDIKRIAKLDCRIVVELYPAKDSFAKTDEEARAMLVDLFNQLGWQKLVFNNAKGKQKFIARNLGHMKKTLPADIAQCHTDDFVSNVRGKLKPPRPVRKRKG